MKMNVKIIVAVLMIGLITDGHAQLHCYVCENCPEGNDLPDELFLSCSGDVTTAPTTPSASTESTVTPSVETTEPTISTSESSTVSITTEQTTEPTQSSTELPPTPSTAPSTEPTSQNTDPTSTEPTTPANPDSPLTTTSLVPSTENIYPTDETTTVTIPTAPPATTIQPTGTPFAFRRVAPFNVRRNSLKQTAYNCFVIKTEVNGTEQVNRGCVVASPNYNDMCRNANANVNPLECRICATDKCNGASGIILSVVLMLCSICTVLSL